METSDVVQSTPRPCPRQLSLRGAAIAAGAAVLGVSVLTAIVAVVSWRGTPSRTLASNTPPGHVEIPDSINGFEIDLASGRQLYVQNCSSCHGRAGQGMPQQGSSLSQSHYVATKRNEQLVSFLKTGRRPGDASSVMNLVMPPRGGNPNLGDQELADIVAYLRQMQQTAAMPVQETAQKPAKPARPLASIGGDLSHVSGAR